MNDVTEVIQRTKAGCAEAREELFASVYDELRRLAAQYMNAERADHTLSATALVHEAYVRMIGSEQDWESRAHVFRTGAEAMRRILVDHARQKLSLKRGGNVRRAATYDDLAVLPADAGLLLDLDDAVCRLETVDTEAAELLKLVLFTGSPVAEAGRMLNMTRDVAYRHWEYIRSWFKVHYGSLRS